MNKQIITSQSLDGLSKAELEDLKLKTEIIKLRNEINEKDKSWASKNLGILIPSFIGFLTLLTGYLTGFFNVEAKRLEIKKDLLMRDVTEFTLKKDALSRKNIELSEKTRVLQDWNRKATSNLSAIARKAILAERAKRELGKELLSISKKKDELQKQKGTLTYQVVTLKKEVKVSSFLEYLSNIKKKPDVSSDHYKGLLYILKKKDEFYTEYYKDIKTSIENSDKAEVKATLMRLMYEATNEIKWKEAVFDIAKKFAEEKKNYSQFNYYGNSSLWEVFQWPFANTDEENVRVIIFLSDLIKKLGNNNRDINQIFTTIGTIKNFVNIDLLESSPKTFCYLVQKAVDITQLKPDDRYLDSSGDFFLRQYAPIAYVCVVSDILKDPKNLSEYERNNLRNNAFNAIGRNNEILQEPAGSSTQNWADWQIRYAELFSLTKNISAHCNDSLELMKIKGK